MGASNIEFEIDKKATMNQINKAFNRQRKQDRSYNGHQEGYSGDFQTVSEIKDHTHKVFNSYNDAQDYCLDHAEKWSYAIAVYYRIKSNKTNNKLDRFQERLTNELTLLSGIDSGLPIAKSLTIGCKSCKSNVTRSYIKGVICPVCKNDLRSTTAINRVASIKDRIDKLRKQITLEENKMALKSPIYTLVCGWGAS